MDNFGNYKIYTFEDFRLDAAHLLLYRDGDQVTITPRAVQTLLALIERPGEVVSKEQLMQAIWGDTVVEESNLSQYLHILRKALGRTRDGGSFIETLKRRGYRFNGNVTLVENGTSQSKQTDDLRDSASSGLRSLRVERQGNVFAVADWLEGEPEASVGPVYTHASTGSGARSRISLAVIAAAAALAIFGAAAVLLWSGFSAAKTSAKDDISFMTLTAGANVDYASISPDGNYFAYASNADGRGHLWVQQTGQMNPIEITDPIAGSIIGTSWTPDSRHIYFVADEDDKETHTLYCVPALGGARTRILNDIAAQVSFSPEGNQFVFIRGSIKERRASIIIATTDGSKERTLVARSLDENVAFYGGGSWSPDGKTIAYGIVDTKRPWAGGCTIVGTDVESAETRPLSSEEWDSCYRMEWTKDSRGLVLIGTRAEEAFSTRRDQVYYLSLETGESRRITTDGNRHQFGSLGVTERDEILAVPFNRLSQIWTMEANGDARTATQITNGFADGRGGIAALDDGRISYLTRNGDGFSIWTMNPDGSNKRQLTTEPPNMQELRSTLDGRALVFSAKRDGRDHLYRIDSNGRSLVQLTDGDSAEDDSSISPDGGWIVFDSAKFVNGELTVRLFRIPAGGGEAVQLTDVECSNPHYSPDGNRISCISADWKTISIISAENGEILSSFKAGSNAVLNVGAHWTPDGSALVYITTVDGVSNLTRQPTDSGHPAPLTDFTSGEIHNFAFSTDGSRIYLARGYSTRNAVLIRNFR